MARVPLLQLSGITLTIGRDPIVQGLDLVIQPGNRIALVGRNGSGKSTLMKVMAGLVEADRGDCSVSSGVSVGYMEQDPVFDRFETLGEFAAEGLDPGESYRIEMAADGLGFDADTPVASASGGERRRAALAKIVAEAPELMLFDEPTNHLDINAIIWMERWLAETGSAFVLISHDRAFLRSLTKTTLWIDRGRVLRREAGIEGFEAWRDKVWESEDQARHKLDRKIKSEARWAVEGISARRRRNQGRLRTLEAMRSDRKAMVRRQGVAALAIERGKISGKRVIEAQGISKCYGDTRILAPFSLRIARGDRVALVGPNGAGKTTLMNMLIGLNTPDTGSVTLGSGVQTAVFDQNRERLDPDMSLWDTLVGDREIGVRGRSDQVMVRGTPRHVLGYLSDFLFSESQARSPVRSLSGGEKARLLLAKIFAKPSNLLALDEPTNDLDLETLDLLQDVLGDYSGTAILISHDRDFIDRVATITVALEGGGRAEVYPGGWSDYRSQRGEKEASPEPVAASTSVALRSPSRRVPKGLGYSEERRLESLPAEIERLEVEIARLTEFLSDPDLFVCAPERFEKASAGLIDRQAALAAAEEEWLELEEKASAK